MGVNGQVVNIPCIRPFIASLKWTRGGYKWINGGYFLLVATLGRESAPKWPSDGSPINKALDIFSQID